MAYFPPYIDVTGLHIPVYNDIFDYLLEQYTAIYGQSVTSNISTTDVQSISMFALMINDSFETAQAIFNGLSPSKAIGAQQDSLYKLNGIARAGATFSTATVTVTGTPNYNMAGRVAADNNGNLWDLPSSFVIPSGGSVDVTAVCETSGPVNAAIGAINLMNNPVVDWTSVYNAAAAFPGTPVEPDSAFRARQALSVVLPSQSLFAGTLAGVAAVVGVTRYGGVENPTGVTDANGTPPHSISVVVEGGANADIAQAIYLNKTPGCLTNGTVPAGNGVTVNVSDPITGQTMPISFYRPTAVPIFVYCKIVALQGYTTVTASAIQTAIVNYLNTLQIGEDLTISALYGAALTVMPNLSQPMFSIIQMQAGLSSGSLGTTDITIAFNAVVKGIAANVTVTT
jgi:uncharacterized phage protein gp47/JayE